MNSVCSDPDEYKVNLMDVLNVILALLTLLTIGKLLYDYYAYKKTGRLPWLATKMPWVLFLNLQQKQLKWHYITVNLNFSALKILKKQQPSTFSLTWDVTLLNSSICKFATESFNIYLSISAASYYYTTVSVYYFIIARAGFITRFIAPTLLHVEFVISLFLILLFLILFVTLNVSVIKK